MLCGVFSRCHDGLFPFLWRMCGVCVAYSPTTNDRLESSVSHGDPIWRFFFKESAAVPPFRRGDLGRGGVIFLSGVSQKNTPWMTGCGGEIPLIRWCRACPDLSGGRYAPDERMDRQNPVPIPIGSGDNPLNRGIVLDFFSTPLINPLTLSHSTVYFAPQESRSSQSPFLRSPPPPPVLLDEGGDQTQHSIPPSCLPI